MNTISCALLLIAIGTLCYAETFTDSDRGPFVMSVLRRSPKSVVARFQPTKMIGSLDDEEWRSEYANAVRRFMDNQAAKRYYYNARVG